MTDDMGRRVGIAAADNRSAMERIAELLHEAGYRPTRRFMGMAFLVYDYARKRYAAPDRIEALEAENERLRETLAKIAALTRVRETRSHQSEWTQDVARAALGEKQ